MKTFYFVGGPMTGQAGEFFRRLNEMGGPPRGWLIYPHVSEDGRALHIAQVESKAEILAHLRHFDGIYECGIIVEIAQPRP